MKRITRLLVASAVCLSWSPAPAQTPRPPSRMPRYELIPRVAAKLPPADRDMFTALLNVQFESAGVALRGLGYQENYTNQVHALSPDARLVGRARTLEMLPGRKDLAETLARPTHLFQVIENANPGDILVFAMLGVTSVGAGGDITTQRFLYRGGAGMIFDGAVHDLDLMRHYDIPIFARNAHTTALQGKLMYTRADVPVSFGGVTITGGDILYGTAAGLLVIPKDVVGKVIEIAREDDLKSEYLRLQIQDGAPLIGTYPANEKSLKGFEQWKQGRRAK